ncbi:MAG TPA: hypothetical protein VGN69_05480 [Solirubrobacteraceae bacterium]|jgi:hypothetical protein|nr:hypothetical protein [Solirubrobacteraceae bacterium]
MSAAARILARGPLVARLGALMRAEGPTVLAAALSAGWLLTELRTPDLAAQVYRATLFNRDGLSLWDNNWYGGHHVPGYSLLFPQLGALLGLRVLGAFSAIASTWLFSRLALAHFGPRARLGTWCFALTTLTDLLIGRLTFALGVTLGLAALLAYQRGRLAAAALGSFLCAAASPVAGLFLALAGAAHLITRVLGLREEVVEATPEAQTLPGGRWPALALMVPALALTGALSVAFPEGGRQPFGNDAFVGAVLLTLAAATLLPREEWTLRVGAGLYVVAVFASFEMRTPMGGNISRLSAMFSWPVLVCAVAGRPPMPMWVGRHASRIGLAGMAVGLGALFAYQWNSPVREVVKTLGEASVNAPYYQPVIDYLNHHQQPLGRLEVPFTKTHWDATFLGNRFMLARGWERQLDTRYNQLFYNRKLTPDAYRTWLEQVGVRYVALPDAAPDTSSEQEVALVRSGLPYLVPVFSSPHWIVFSFTHPQALTDGPGRLLALHNQSFEVALDRPGLVRVRVHFTPYWEVVGGRGCVSQGSEGWTQVRASRPGTIRVVARFDLGRVLDHGPRCR